MSDSLLSFQRLRGWSARLRRNDQLLLSALALLIGLAAGLAATAFRYAIEGVQRLTFGFGGEKVATLAAGLAWWHLLLVPTAGGADSRARALAGKTRATVIRMPIIFFMVSSRSCPKSPVEFLFLTF